MWNLSEYQKHPRRLSDYLPWAAFIGPGVILNKDGSFQRTIRFRGPDTGSATPGELMAMRARQNTLGYTIMEVTQRLVIIQGCNFRHKAGK